MKKSIMVNGREIEVTGFTDTNTKKVYILMENWVWYDEHSESMVTASDSLDKIKKFVEDRDEDIHLQKSEDGIHGPQEYYTIDVLNLI